MVRPALTKPATPPTAPLVVVIGGPTATGKSALALALAERLDGEIICGDSRQIYAGISIASAAPDDADLARCPHHLYGTVAPESAAPMTAGTWTTLADDAVAAVHARKRTAIIVGGTGLYLRAWRVGLDAEPGDPVVRARLESELAKVGAAALHARLAALDADAAEAIEVADALRIVRALEIIEVSGGAPRGAQDLATKPPRERASVQRARWLLVDAPLDELEPRIAERAVRMFAGGIVDEAVALEKRAPGHRLLETIGVREALDVARGRADVDGAVAGTRLRTRQYARRQRTWFKKEPWWTRLTSVNDAARMVDDALAALVVDG